MRCSKIRRGIAILHRLFPSSDTAGKCLLAGKIECHIELLSRQLKSGLWNCLGNRVFGTEIVNSVPVASGRYDSNSN